MKQKEFIKKIENSNLDKIIIPVYWTLNENENVIVDFEGMREEFEQKLKDIKNIL